MPFINRCGDTPKLQTKTVTPTTSQQIIAPDTGYEGLEKVVVNAPVFQAKTVTVDGTVTADNGYSGLSSVTVNVPYDMLYVESSIYNIGSNGIRSLDFELGDVMNYHDSNPDRIIIYILSRYGIKTNGETTSRYNIYGQVFGVNLIKYSDTKYIGKLYSENTNYNTHTDDFKGAIMWITENDAINNYAVNVSYDSTTKKISVSLDRVIYKSSEGFGNVSFVAGNYSTVPYGGCFIWY